MRLWALLALMCGCTAVIEGKLSDKPTEDETTSSSTGGSDASGGASSVSSTTAGPGPGGGMPQGGNGGNGPLCAPYDAFDDDMIDSQWEPLLLGGNVAISEPGELHIDVAAGTGNRWGRILTAMPHDTTACGMTISFAGTITAEEMVYAELYIDVGNRAGFHLVGNELRMRQEIAAVVESTDVPYNSNSDRWWRVVWEGNELVWFTSPDGVSWMERVRKISALDPMAMHILIGAGVFGMTTAGVNVEFDQLNWPP